jgi:hypothetical protein
MAEVVKITKKVMTTLSQATKYQILTHCFYKDIQISNADLICLTLLAQLGEHELTEFCKLATEKQIFKSPQSARNAINKAAKKGLVIKNGKSKKTVTLTKEIEVQNNKVVLLDFKILGK